MDRTAQEREDHILDCYETIKQQDAEIERLREALQEIASVRTASDWNGKELAWASDIARRALEEKK